MITAERKPLEELIEYVRPFKRILLVGCNECVTVLDSIKHGAAEIAAEFL